MKAYLLTGLTFLSTGIYFAANEVGFLALLLIGFGLICLSFSADVFEH